MTLYLAPVLATYIGAILGFCLTFRRLLYSKSE